MRRPGSRHHLPSPVGKHSPDVVRASQELLVEAARSDQLCAVLMELRGVAVGFISPTLVGRKPQPLR